MISAQLEVDRSTKSGRLYSQRSFTNTTQRCTKEASHSRLADQTSRQQIIESPQSQKSTPFGPEIALLIPTGSLQLIFAGKFPRHDIPSQPCYLGTSKPQCQALFTDQHITNPSSATLTRPLHELFDINVNITFKTLLLPTFHWLQTKSFGFHCGEMKRGV
jgi:hypothetical protein